MTDDKKIKTELIFAPGCFDDFEGTQEELDEMIAEIQRLVDSGEIHERATPVDLDGLLGEMSDAEFEELMNEVQSTQNRNLQ